MSAYVVSKVHIDALVELAHLGPSRAPQYPSDGYYSPRWEDESGEWVAVDHENADEVGHMLLSECIWSVKYRYHDEPIADLPGTPTELQAWEDATPAAYRFSPLRRKLTAAEGINAVNGYEYQSCEHPGWKGSEAKRFCESLKDSLVMRLPEVEAADGWNVDRLQTSEVAST